MVYFYFDARAALKNAQPDLDHPTNPTNQYSAARNVGFVGNITSNGNDIPSDSDLVKAELHLAALVDSDGVARSVEAQDALWELALVKAKLHAPETRQRSKTDCLDEGGIQ